MTGVEPPAYLAFDLGASSGRAIVGHLDGTKLRMEVVHRFATPIFEEEERLYWDLDALWIELTYGLEAARQVAPALRSLSVDSWGVDYVPVGYDALPIRRAYCYRDPRTDGLPEAVFRIVPPNVIYEATGIQFMSINTLYQILDDVLREPGLIPLTAYRLPIADYFNFRFSGRPASEVSLASTTQLMRVGTRQWASEIFEPLGLPLTGWPEIVDSGTVLGEYDGLRVVAGCSHDTGCAVAATPGGLGEAWAYISCGTWSLLGVELTAPILGDSAREAGFTNEAGLGGTIRFLKNLTGLWALQECVREWGLEGDDVYDQLDAQAEAAPAPQGPLDLEDARFLARGNMESRLHDACREAGIAVPASRGETTRLILESIADSYRRTFLTLEHLLGRRIDTIHLVGGGSRNTLLCRLTADTCSRRVVAGPVEATAAGNLLIQMLALGDLPRDRSLRDVVRASFPIEVYEPRAAPSSEIID